MYCALIAGVSSVRRWSKTVFFLTCLGLASCGGGGGGGGGAPTNVVVTPGPGPAGDLVVSWTAPATLGSDGNPLVIAGFNVYRGGSPVTLVLLTTVPVSNNPPIAAETTFTDTTAISGNIFFYAVTAVDALGSESPRSTVVSAVAP